MKQAGAIRRRRRPAETFPDVETDMVVVAARRNKRSLLTISLGQFETENAAIEAERALEVGDLQVDVADANAGIDRCRHSIFCSHGAMSPCSSIYRPDI